MGRGEASIASDSSTPRLSNKSLSNGTMGHSNLDGRQRKHSTGISSPQSRPSLEAFMMMKTLNSSSNGSNSMRRSTRKYHMENHHQQQHPQNLPCIQFQQQQEESNSTLPPPPLSDACIDSPDTPRHFHIAQQAGLAARDRFETLQRTSRLVKQPQSRKSNSNKSGNLITTPDDLLLLTWDDICIEQLLGVGGFACVCLVTCDKLWKTHKRQYLVKKWQTSGDLDSVDSSLLPPSEDSWMATSTVGSNASTAETNAERYYALKCLSKQTTLQGFQHEELKTRYMSAAADLVAEAFLLSKLDHPNIVRLYGVTGGSVDQAFLHKGGFFLVMEALNSVLDDMIQVWRKDAVQSVGDFLRKATETVPCLEERLAIALEIARGMDYLHSKNIIFRDLKPHNVGIDRDGGLRLFDFGLARECLSGICPGKAGSRRYMAPETMANKITCFSSDVYSFGITLWELIGLARPVQSESADEFERAVCIDDYRPSIDVIEDQAIRRLIEQCWQKELQQRPTFSQIIDSLRQILQTSNHGNWLHTKAGTDLLDGGSFHLTRLSKESKLCDGSSYESLMNDSLMTDGSQSRVSALTIESSRTSRTSSSSSIPSVPRSSGSSGDEIQATRKPQPVQARRPPKGPRERPPDKNESETTVGISNTAQSLRARRSNPEAAMGTGERPKPTISGTMPLRMERPPPGPRWVQQSKTHSTTTTVSAPEVLMTPSSECSISSCSSGQSRGSAIQWQRRHNRSPGSLRDRRVRRTHSEPLSHLMSATKTP
ncbi:protein tyrosine kinase [Nitzschia inconspicua]|uniref:Protein tyrosine kinase n=1 Tax=Nitzschia inconspicua TaxID=303405 RepID=A0A9K3LY56_9STRA|nr:protein tyrosine kinase [Nitzschia inconspicua]